MGLETEIKARSEVVDFLNKLILTLFLNKQFSFISYIFLKIGKYMWLIKLYVRTSTVGGINK